MFLNIGEFDMNPQLAAEQPTVDLIIPEVLATYIGQELRAKGHIVEVTRMQRPCSQQPSGAGAVKIVWINPVSEVFFGAVSPAKDDYVMGW